MLRRIVSIIGYTAFLLAVVILGTELGLRAYFDDIEYRGGGYVNTSPNSFVNHDGFWLYKPNSIIRQVAVYGFPIPKYFPGEEFSVEYDCQFRTNRFGLQGDNDQYIESRRTVLILGDSFTEGRGGCPWMDDVVSQYPDFNVLNGGLQATGIESFYRLYKHLIAQGVEVSKVIVIAIADDFMREPFLWPQDALDCLSFKRKCTKQWKWHPATLYQTHGELIEKARERAREMNVNLSEKSKRRLWFARHVYFYSFLTGTLDTYFGKQASRNGPSGVGPTKNNLDALKLLISADVGMELILAPQRDEVAMRKPNIHGAQLRKDLKALNIRYSFCELTQGDFLPRDPHPNSDGYQKLASCLRGKLDVFKSTTSM